MEAIEPCRGFKGPDAGVTRESGWVARRCLPVSTHAECILPSPSCLHIRRLTFMQSVIEYTYHLVSSCV